MYCTKLQPVLLISVSCQASSSCFTEHYYNFILPNPFSASTPSASCYTIMQIIQTIRYQARELTFYFVYLLLVATLGPFLFGYHLVCYNTTYMSTLT